VGCSRHETHQRARHPKFIPTTSGEVVQTVPARHEATSFEAVKRNKHCAVADAPSEGGRVRILRDESEHPDFRHTSR
jgi:hypothetical protein